MGEGFSDAVFGYDLTPEQQEHLKEVATSKDIKQVSHKILLALFKCFCNTCES